MQKVKSKLFKSEDSKLFLRTGLTFVSVTIIAVLLISFLFWIVIEMNSNFFTSHSFGGSEGFKDAYLDIILSFVIERLYLILAFLVILFFLGAYAGESIIRPFKNIASHCESLKDNNNIIYGSDKMSEFKVLQSFAHLFFNYLRNCLKNEQIEKFKVPEEFNRIREFSNDRTFLINYSVSFTAIILAIMWFFIASANEIQSSTLELAFKLLPSTKTEVFVYLKELETVWDMILFVSFFIIVACYSLLARYMYKLVSGASLGYFLTMKSFVKGNYSSRVHLVGYNYIRPYARYFNKYLDHFCRELKINTK